MRGANCKRITANNGCPTTPPPPPPLPPSFPYHPFPYHGVTLPHTPLAYRLTCETWTTFALASRIWKKTTLFSARALILIVPSKSAQKSELRKLVGSRVVETLLNRTSSQNLENATRRHIATSRASVWPGCDFRSFEMASHTGPGHFPRPSLPLSMMTYHVAIWRRVVFSKSVCCILSAHSSSPPAELSADAGIPRPAVHWRGREGRRGGLQRREMQRLHPWGNQKSRHPHLSSEGYEPWLVRSLNGL